MGLKGIYEIWECDICRAEAHLIPGEDINRHPSWTNQNWSYDYWNGRDAKCICRSCQEKEDT